ncbi:MAG: very short patch repair endonuclease [Nitrosotalea sp.]
MSDIFSKSKRSHIMSRIRSKDTKLDLAMESILKSSKLTFKKYPKMFGKPDFLIRKKLAVFCDSSFWHGRNWKALKNKLEEGNNSTYWVSHIARNRKRDKTVNRKLKTEGYSVIRFWDTDVYKRPDWCIDEIRKRL